jgi:glycosyltransferase involved in cell wall biosynthesis
MSVPFFTIIIPTFNSEKKLQNALNSILQQTFSDFEILIIDGLSRDNTVNIIKENANKDKRIRFVSEKDNGIYDAMNKGITLAKSDWIYFLGSDDHLFNDKVLHAVFGNLKNNDCDMLYGNVCGVAFKGKYDGEFDEEKLLKKNISHQAIFYNKHIFSKIGNFNTRYRTHADWDLNISCFENSSIKAKYIDLLIAEFAVGGASSSYDIPFLRERLFPVKLHMLNRVRRQYLHEIVNYDEWWRLLRNAKIREFEIDKYAGAGLIPGCIKSMAKWQQKIPYRILKMGIFSKLLMLTNYLYNRLNRTFR